MDTSDKYQELNREGERHYAAGRIDEARRCFEQSVELCPTEPIGLNNLAVYYWQRGAPEKAHHYFTQCLAHSPGFKSATVNLFEWFHQQNRLNEFVPYGRQYIKIHPSDAEVDGLLRRAQAAFLIQHAKKTEAKMLSCAAASGHNAGIQVSIIIPCYNQSAFTKLCMEYLPETIGHLSCEIIFIDNGSSDETWSVISGFGGPVKRFRNHKNTGFASACNQGARAAEGETLVFLNNDIVPRKGWLDHMLESLDEYQTGIVGAKLIYPNDTIQHAGVAFLHSHYPFHIYQGCSASASQVNIPRPMDAITGACLMISKKLFDEVSGFDEAYFNGLEDIDLCLRVWEMGYVNRYQPLSVLVHFESRSEGRQKKMETNREVFIRRWGPKISENTLKLLLQDGLSMMVNADNTGFVYLPDEDINNIAETHLTEAENIIAAGQRRKGYEGLLKIVQNFPYFKKGTERLMEFAAEMNDTEMVLRCKIILKNYPKDFQAANSF